VLDCSAPCRACFPLNATHVEGSVPSSSSPPRRNHPPPSPESPPLIGWMALRWRPLSNKKPAFDPLSNERSPLPSPLLPPLYLPSLSLIGWMSLSWRPLANETPPPLLLFVLGLWFLPSPCPPPPVASFTSSRRTHSQRHSPASR